MWHVPAGAAAKKRKAQVIESEDDAESAPDSGSDYQVGGSDVLAEYDGGLGGLGQ